MDSKQVDKFLFENYKDSSVLFNKAIPDKLAEEYRNVGWEVKVFTDQDKTLFDYSWPGRKVFCGKCKKRVYECELNIYESSYCMGKWADWSKIRFEAFHCPYCNERNSIKCGMDDSYAKAIIK